MATQDPVHVDTNAMRQGASQVQDGATSVNSIGSGVQQNIDSLMRTWTGQSATGFNAAMGDFYRQTDDIVKMLSNLAGQVTESASQYDVAHGHTVDQADSLRRQLANANTSSSAPGLRGF